MLRILCALLVMALALGTSFVTRCEARTPPTRRSVVSYFVTESIDSNQVEPSDEVPMSVLPPQSWQWRLYDPHTGRDVLFLELAFFPMHVRWDSTFSSVAFLSGNQILEVPWKLRGTPRVVATLPVDSCVCDFWVDPRGGAHLVTQESYQRKSPHDGRAYEAAVAIRRDRVCSGQWTVGEVDSGAGGHYGECAYAPSLERSRPREITMSSLLSSMWLENYHDSTISRDLERSDNQGWLWIASGLGSSIGLEMQSSFGDTNHANEPVIWVDRSRHLRREVYSEGQSKDEMAGQIAFAERGGHLLVASEYTGAYPAVVDMRSGEVLFRVDRPSARAVWVPAPR